MNYRSCFKLALLTPLFVLGVASQAQTSGGAFYFGASAGKADGSGPAYKYGSDPSLGLALGYRLNDQVALEAFARGLSFRLFGEVLGPKDAYQVPSRHMGVAVEGLLPLSGDWGAYGRLGVGRTQMEGSSTGKRLATETDASFGGGIRYGLGAGFAFKLGLERYSKSKVNVTYLGVQYQF